MSSQFGWIDRNSPPSEKSLMAQGAEFPLRKPPGFHYDFFLLGITTFLAGLLGVPAPNGLIPQAPIHTTSLLVMGSTPKRDLEDASCQVHPRSSMVNDPKHESGTQQACTRLKPSSVQPPSYQAGFKQDPSEICVRRPDDTTQEVPVAVVEQRVSNLVQGALCLVLLTGPFLHVLNLIPRGVLAGLL